MGSILCRRIGTFAEAVVCKSGDWGGGFVEPRFGLQCKQHVLGAENGGDMMLVCQSATLKIGTST